MEKDKFFFVQYYNKKGDNWIDVIGTQGIQSAKSSMRHYAGVYKSKTRVIEKYYETVAQHEEVCNES